MMPSGTYFSPSEVSRASSGDVPDELASNAWAMLALLDRVRAAGGVPLQLTSFYRSPAKNLAVGGAGRSPHLVAAAADVVPIGLDVVTWATRIAGESFGQLIVYPHTDGHAHITLPSFPNGAQGQTLVLVGNPNKYASWLPGGPVPPWGAGSVTVSSAPDNEGGAPVSWIALGFVAFLVVGFLLHWWRA
jgi:hypothetical protein